MGISTKEFQVDDTRYAVTHYTSNKGMKILGKIVKLVGEPVGIMAGRGLDAEADPDLIGKAVSALVKNIDPEELPRFATEILGTTIIFTENGQNRGINFDLDFSGKLGALFKVIKEVLTFQFADFLPDLAGAMLASQAKAKPGRVKAL